MATTITRDSRVLVSDSRLCLTGCKARLEKFAAQQPSWQDASSLKLIFKADSPRPSGSYSKPGRRGVLPAAIGQCYPNLRLLAAGNGVGVPRLTLLSLQTVLLTVLHP